METTTHRHSFMVISTTQADQSQQLYNVSHIPNSPLLPDYPDKFGPSTAWMIDMNYLMPFSVMLMILCVLLLILCYLRHRMRQRRQLQRELRLSHIMHSTDRQQLDGMYPVLLPIFSYMYLHRALFMLRERPRFDIPKRVSLDYCIYHWRAIRSI